MFYIFFFSFFYKFPQFDRKCADDLKLKISNAARSDFPVEGEKTWSRKSNSVWIVESSEQWVSESTNRVEWIM